MACPAVAAITGQRISSSFWWWVWICVSSAAVYRQIAGDRERGALLAAIWPRQAASRRRSWRIARWMTTMDASSGSGSSVVLALSANDGAVVMSRAWASVLVADLPRTCGPVAGAPG